MIGHLHVQDVSLMQSPPIFTPLFDREPPSSLNHHKVHLVPQPFDHRRAVIQPWRVRYVTYVDTRSGIPH